MNNTLGSVPPRIASPRVSISVQAGQMFSARAIKAQMGNKSVPTLESVAQENARPQRGDSKLKGVKLKRTRSHQS